MKIKVLWFCVLIIADLSRFQYSKLIVSEFYLKNNFLATLCVIGIKPLIAKNNYQLNIDSINIIIQVIFQDNFCY